MEKQKRIVRFLTRKLSIGSFLDGLTDIRHQPRIDLRTILVCVLLMPIYCLSSLLSLDRWGRGERAKTLFGCTRKLLASDSTVTRVLRWLKRADIDRLALRLAARLDTLGLLTRRLTPGATERRLALIDGSQMSGTDLVCFSLLGAIRYPVLIERIAGKGYEKGKAKDLIEGCTTALAGLRPQLLLLDCLYFDQYVFRAARKEHMDVLVKFDDPALREISREAAQDFAQFGGTREAHGYDSERLCRFSVRVSESEYYGVGVQLAEVDETYSKRHDDRWHTRFWVICTDLSLSPKELREAAHLRWQIENNVFRRLNEVSGTKHGYTRHPIAFINLVRLLAMGLTVGDVLQHLLESRPTLSRLLLDGQKPTRKAILLSFTERFPAGCFTRPP